MNAFKRILCRIIGHDWSFALQKRSYVYCRRCKCRYYQETAT